MKRNRLGFVVSCTNKEHGKPYQIKLYSVIQYDKVVRFRLTERIGSFDSFEEAAHRSGQFATQYKFPYAWRIKHNFAVPNLIYKWYFKNPPVSFSEIVSL